MTFTVTNTTDPASKNGWSFTDALPSGLTVTSPAASTTCPSGVVAAGGSSVTMTGNLSAGMTSCTVTVNVTSSTVASYTNGPSNMTLTGLNPPANATVSFNAAPPTLTKSINPATIASGGIATYTWTVANTAATAVALSSGGFTDALPSGIVLAASPNVTFSGTTSSPTVTAPAGGSSVAVSGLNVAAGATATITAAVTNAPGQLNASCAANPAAFTNSSSNVSGIAGGTTNAVANVCLVVQPAVDLTVAKTDGVTNFTASQALTYTYTATDSGGTPLSTIDITEITFSGTGTVPDVSACAAAIGPLVVGQSGSCTATYTVTAAGKSIMNTASATATPPNGPPVSSNIATATIKDTPIVALAFTGAPQIEQDLLVVALLIGFGCALMLAAGGLRRLRRQARQGR